MTHSPAPKKGPKAPKPRKPIPKRSAKKLAADQQAGRPCYSTVARATKKVGRNKSRQASEFTRCFHSKDRVAFIKSLSCVATGKFGNIDNAHVCDDGSKGMGRRSGYRCIVPLSRNAHRLLHRDPAKFAALYGPFDWPAMAAYTESQWVAHVGGEA